jgi:hypothetical protein
MCGFLAKIASNSFPLQCADMSPPITEPSAVAPDAGVNQGDNSKATRLC